MIRKYNNNYIIVIKPGCNCKIIYGFSLKFDFDSLLLTDGSTSVLTVCISDNRTRGVCECQCGDEFLGLYVSDFVQVWQ